MVGVASKHLFDTGRRVTRLQIKMIADVFPFLEMPAEMRIAVYEDCFDFDGITRFFDKYYSALPNPYDSKRPTNTEVTKKTPTIFLINRQIFYEATALYRKRTVIFNHGLLELRLASRVTPSVISRNVLRQVGAIEISDDGHALLTKGVQAPSWHGYMKLIRALCDILEGGHSLKKLAIRFSDPKMVDHMTKCYDNDQNCGFRDQIQALFDNSLSKVRNVPQVTLSGFNPQRSRAMVRRMQSAPLTFADLDTGIRKKIFGMCFDNLDVSDKLAISLAGVPVTPATPIRPSSSKSKRAGKNAKSQGKESAKRKRGAKRNHSAQHVAPASPDAQRSRPIVYPSVPSVFFLNNKYRTEALAAVAEKPLVITIPADDYRNLDTFNLRASSYTNFKLLPTVKHLTIDIQTCMPSKLLHALVDFLKKKHSLESLHIKFVDAMKDFCLSYQLNTYPDSDLHEMMKCLAEIRGINQVTIEGSLPFCYSDPLSEIMSTAADAPAHRVPKLRLLQGNGNIVDLEE